MQFGGRQLPLALRVGRMLIYIQAFFLVYWAAMAVLVSVLFGSQGGGLTAGGKMLGSGAALTIAAINVVLAVAAVLLAIEAAKFSVNARYWLTGLEVLIAIYFLFMGLWLGSDAGDVGAWISRLLLGPALSGGIIACHFWPSVQESFATAPAGAGSAPAFGSSGTKTSTVATEKPSEIHPAVKAAMAMEAEAKAKAEAAKTESAETKAESAKKKAAAKPAAKPKKAAGGASDSADVPGGGI